jgi:hypothetical protein
LTIVSRIGPRIVDGQTRCEARGDFDARVGFDLVTCELG